MTKPTPSKATKAHKTKATKAKATKAKATKATKAKATKAAKPKPTKATKAKATKAKATKTKATKTKATKTSPSTPRAREQQKAPPTNQQFQAELIAAVIGALLVIPQAISFSILAGVKPEYGLYCAIFMGLIASLLGKSPIISGPNTAVAILIGTTLVQFAEQGTVEYSQYLVLLTLMVTLCQFSFYAFRAHKIFDYISPVTIKAITTCIGILLIVSSLDGIMGIPSSGPQSFYQKVLAIPGKIPLLNPYAFAVALCALVTGLATKIRWPRYYLAVALVCGLGAGYAVDQLYLPSESQMARLSTITIAAQPFFLPDLSFVTLAMVEALLIPAAAIAYLGLSQTLVIAKGIESIPNITKLDVSPALRSCLVTEVSLRREVLAQAAGNLACCFLGSYAGSGSFNRTMVNLAVGSKTKLAGILSALLVGVFMLAFADILATLPMAVIYASLLIVGIGMIRRADIVTIMSHPKERWLFMIVIITLLFFGLTAGIAVALVLSVALLAFATSQISWSCDDRNGRYRARGTLNFVTEQDFRQKITSLFAERSASQLKTTELDLTGLLMTDSAFAMPLDEFLAPWQKKGVTVLRTEDTLS